MGEIADMMFEDAIIGIAESEAYVDELNDNDLVLALKETLNSCQYAGNSFTPMIGSIVEYYERKGFISEKQRYVLIKHYGIYGEMK